jgi:glutamine synthetase
MRPPRPTGATRTARSPYACPPEQSKARRLEHRVPGADANPYLVFAAILAAALDGIERGLSPGEPVSGDGYSQDGPLLPIYMQDALRLFGDLQLYQHRPRARNAAHLRPDQGQELAEFQRHITSLEYHAYVERL